MVAFHSTPMHDPFRRRNWLWRWKAIYDFELLQYGDWVRHGVVSGARGVKEVRSALIGKASP